MARHLARFESNTNRALERIAEAEARRMVYSKHRLGGMRTAAEDWGKNWNARIEHLTLTERAIRHFGIGRRARDGR